MIGVERARRLLAELKATEGTVAEVLVKEGRSRRSELGVQGLVSVATEERGWAVRVARGRGSFFACGTGRPALEAEWPAPTGPPLRLPEAHPVPSWEPGPAIEAALMVEGEARGLLEGIERQLAGQLAGARLLRAVLDDGSSETHLISSRGIDVGFRSRLAMLHLEAVQGGNTASRVRLEVAATEARALQPGALARRLADCLTARGGEPGPARDRGEMVLAPAVAASLVSALRPLWLGPEAAARAAGRTDRDGRLAARALSVVDDPRFAGGGLAAPVDGEGVPTRRMPIVERGRYVGPLRDWRGAADAGRKPAGCVRRPGWRDLPRPGFSHLFIVPDEGVAPAELVSSVSRGFYLLDVLGPARVDLDADRFALPVSGFALARGRATATVGRAWLRGGVGALLRGVRAVGRDLTFLPLDGMIGSPSLLLGGLELRRELD